MSYLVAPFCSELEELTYDLVEGAFRQEPSVSIDRLHRHLGLPFGDHDSQIAITLGAIRKGSSMELINTGNDLFDPISEQKPLDYSTLYLTRKDRR
jgi:hypothetical protein